MNFALKQSLEIRNLMKEIGLLNIDDQAIEMKVDDGAAKRIQRNQVKLLKVPTMKHRRHVSLITHQIRA
jgi:hypothetical protein